MTERKPVFRAPFAPYKQADAWVGFPEGKHLSVSFFQEEAEKIEARSEDLKVGLERDIKKLDKEITAQQKESRKARSLAEKLEAQKGLRTLETRRDTKRRQYFEEQDRIKRDQDALIAGLESALQKKRVELHPVLTLRWHLEAVPTATASNEGTH